MELIDWLGLFFILTPVWGLAYALFRLIGRWSKPEGVPPGRRGGMSGPSWSGVPLGDAPAYGHRLNKEEEGRRKRDDGGATP